MDVLLQDHHRERADHLAGGVAQRHPREPSVPRRPGFQRLAELQPIGLSQHPPAEPEGDGDIFDPEPELALDPREVAFRQDHQGDRHEPDLRGEVREIVEGPADRGGHGVGIRCHRDRQLRPSRENSKPQVGCDRKWRTRLMK